jgi:hypothetical protein
MVQFYFIIVMIFLQKKSWRVRIRYTGTSYIDSMNMMFSDRHVRRLTTEINILRENISCPNPQNENIAVSHIAQFIAAILTMLPNNDSIDGHVSKGILFLTV